MEVDMENGVDEGLYSRQLYVMGHQAQRAMASSSVLLMGLNGLGVEIAKNIILAGVRSVTLWDDSPVQMADLGSQCYFSEADVGNPRAAACITQLRELNQYVEVLHHTGDVTAQVISGFQVCVCIGEPLARQIELDNQCRAAGVRFIACDTFGLFASVFCDFGQGFQVFDTNGEPEVTCTVSSITQGNPGVVEVLDDQRHNMETGDYVQFANVEGMTELNDMPPQPITVTGPFSFTICSTENMPPCIRGGYVSQVKQTVNVDFLSLQDAIANPGELPMYDCAKFLHAPALHIAFRALHAFRTREGRFPAPGNEADANAVVALAVEINTAAGGNNELNVENLEEEFASLIGKIARGSKSVLAPMTSFIGGIAGQEVLKACTGKFMPIKGFLHYEAMECLPEELPTEAACQPQNSRYDDFIGVFGLDFQELLTRQRMFLVGAGAIGCEMLKCWALMGVGASAEGQVFVTDMDIIERSNLNRQFLFRPSDVGNAKSECAVNAAVQMNPSFSAQAFVARVGSETEEMFSDAFFSNLTGVCNALDNIEARLYMDQRCVFYRLPLLESGTQGTKGNTQIVVPGMTENYGASRDPPEKGIPLCTLKNFPNAIEHCIQWATDFFQGVFFQEPANANSYLSTPDFLTSLNAPLATQMETLQSIKQSLVDERPLSFEACVDWARCKFEELYRNTFVQLLHNFPVDQVTASGVPFWSGAKKPPTPIVFDENDSVHLDFVMAAANLRAKIYGLSGENDSTYFVDVLSRTTVPEFQPRSGVKIAADDEEAKAAAEEAAKSTEVTRDSVSALQAQVPTSSDLAGYRLEAVEFEKDDDAHMAFIVAASNLRARAYKIPEADLHRTRQIAGKIIPAIATSTAAVTGLVCLEYLKVLQGKPLEQYRNSFFNLALPLVTSVEPAPAAVTTVTVKGEEWSWSLWDSIDICEPDMTVQGLLDYFDTTYNLELSMISCGVAMLYYFFSNKAKKRLPSRLVDVAQEVTKRTPAPSQQYLIFEVCATDKESGDDVEVPYVKFRFRQ